MSWVKHDDFCIFIIHRSNCPYETSQWGLAGVFLFFFCIVVKKNIYSVLKIVFVWESWLFYLRLFNLLKEVFKLIMFMLAISMKSGRETDEESLHFLSRRRPEEGFLGGYCFSNMFITTGSGELGVNHSFTFSRIVIALISKIELKLLLPTLHLCARVSHQHGGPCV